MLGLRTTIYKVPDLSKAKAWYAKAFNTQPYFDEPFYVGFNIAGYELGLLPDEATTGDNVLSYWGVDDIDAEYNRLISQGATEHENPTDVGGDIKTASVKDPWGNVVGLIFNPHFKLDAGH
jgi:predicted enzyme related to lactoylglutathione lyase